MALQLPGPSSREVRHLISASGGGERNNCAPTEPHSCQCHSTSESHVAVTYAYPPHPGAAGFLASQTAGRRQRRKGRQDAATNAAVHPSILQTGRDLWPSLDVPPSCERSSERWTGHLTDVRCAPPSAMDTMQSMPRTYAPTTFNEFRSLTNIQRLEKQRTGQTWAPTDMASVTSPTGRLADASFR